MVSLIAAPVQGAAQIAALPSAAAMHRPQVLVTPNGVPMVNITTPSAAGVSRNIYQQFDVDRKGAILNNSRAGAQTNLGGAVGANPWLANGAARVILNEVRSNDPSLLRGPVEVAGQRAEVVIANPSGIQVDGGAFINASRATLTTGTPEVNALGGLERYVVRDGTITVDGAGLDLSRTDYGAILARAIKVNSAIWANYLQATGGANEIDAATGEAKPVEGKGERPQFRLDVALLGGMYAGKIFLNGSEHGLGVRNFGTLSSTGDLILTSDGKLVNKGTIEAASVKIKSSEGIDNQGGTIRQTQALGITVAAANLQNTGGTIGAEPVRPPPKPDGNTPILDGADGSGGNGGGSQNAGTGGNGASGGQGNGAQPVVEEVAPSLPPPATTPGHIETAGTLLNEGGRIYHGGAITLQAQQLNNAGGSIQVADAALGGAVINTDGKFSASGRLAIDAERIDNTKGTIRAGEAQLRASAINAANAASAANAAGATGAASSASAVIGSIDNRGGSIAATGALSLEAVSIDNSAGFIGAEGALALKAPSITNAGSGRIAGQSSVAIHAQAATGGASSLFDNRGGQVLAGTDLRIDAGAVENAGGSLLANRDLRLDASSFTAEGQIEASRNVGIAVQGDSANRTAVRAGADLSYTAGGTFTNTGKLSAAKTLDVSAAAIDNIASGDLAGGVTKLRTLGTLTNRGVIDGNDTEIDAGSLLNIGTGRIYGDFISIGAGTLRNDTETVAGKATSATIAARQNLDIGAGSIVNREHSFIFSAGDLYIGGSLDADRYATGQGTSLDNQSARIEALGTIELSMARTTNSDAHMEVVREKGEPVEVRRTITPQGGLELPFDQFVLDPNSRTWATTINGQLLKVPGLGSTRTTSGVTASSEVVTATGSALSGGLLALQAGQNLTLEGSSLSGDTGVLLRAGNQQLFRGPTSLSRTLKPSRNNEPESSKVVLKTS
ncbi:Filamentous hemagglutinin (fragment) [Burkholderiales bacterium 8X]